MEKIPDIVLTRMVAQENKKLLVEIGTLKSYIEELEHELKTGGRITPEEKVKIKANEVYQAQKKQIKDLEKKVVTMRSDINRIINQRYTNQNICAS